MNGRRFACLVGAVSVVAACSGTYDVGMGAGGAAGSLPTAGASFAGSPPSAGQGNVAGSSGGSALEYCGALDPVAPLEVLAPPSIVARRIQEFVLGSSVEETNLPETTTRAWASSYALSVLDSVSVPSTPGMQRVVKKWWPGTTEPELWASFFSSRRGSFLDLLQSEDQFEHGAGVLTDISVLEIASISRRGARIAANLFCQDIPLPPANEPALEPPGPGQTRRDALEAQLTVPACKACHSSFDGPGYALETFATDGAWSSTYEGLPIDTSFQLPRSEANPAGQAYSDIRDYGEQTAASCEAISCFSRRLLETAKESASLPGDGVGERYITGLAYEILRADGDLRHAVKAVVESDFFLQPE